MSNNSLSTAELVQKVWRYAHVLKDDGLAFMDYTEQITYLLFLKMAWEQQGSSGAIPSRYTWNSLLSIECDSKLLATYHEGLLKLSEEQGLVGLIFTKPQSKINDPAKLRHLMLLIDSEHWSNLDVDVKGAVYEGLLARNAEDVRGGAGQYFTPRAVIRAVVEVMRPTSRLTICDPACGTGGFLIAAFEYLNREVKSVSEEKFLRNRALKGIDLVPNVARLCAMNLFLHGIGEDADHPVVSVGDSLECQGEPMDMILTNPPFGKRSSFTVVGRDGGKRKEGISYSRDDFWVTTSNKQLNFVQHVYSSLHEGGRAAVVVPDNVLFEGGAGEKVRRSLLEYCRVHTLLRLPSGIWYSPAVKANVLFFDRIRQETGPATRDLWVYDLRNQEKFSLRRNPIQDDDLADFVSSYRAKDVEGRRETDLFRRYSYSEIVARDKANWDIRWSVRNPVRNSDKGPEVLMQEIVADLSEAIQEFKAAEQILGNGAGSVTDDEQL